MPTLNYPQHRFIEMTDRVKFAAFVAGFGGGKTWVGSTNTTRFILSNPKINTGYFAPTYKLVRDVYYPTVEEVAYSMDCRVKIRTGDNEVDTYRGGRYYGTTICRTMDNPENIVGFKVGHAHVDEIDVMKAEKAELANRKIMARMRYKVAGLRNGIDYTTTPEGFRWVYERFHKNPTERHGLIQASTYDNEKNLPDDYIPSLFESYPPQLINAYLNGQFVNLTEGSVYPSFDRRLNHTDETITKGEHLHIGMDFNVNKMSATVNVIRDGKPRQLAEVFGVRDTPQMCDVLLQRFEGHRMTVYPDSSGKNTSSKSADVSDLSILRDRGFSVIVKSTNPAVRARVNSFNAQICNAVGERNFLVNTKLCPHSTECYEQQIYNTAGEPDKTQDRDHLPDAQGYFIHSKWPINKPVTKANIRFPL